MTYLVERLAKLREYLDHLHRIRARVAGTDTLRADLSLFNDVVFSLQTVSQLVIDIAGELSARRSLPFNSYADAVRNLREIEGFSPALVERLARLPVFRNAVVHDYIELDLTRVLTALDDLEPLEEFVGILTARREL